MQLFRLQFTWLKTKYEEELKERKEKIKNE